MELSNKTKHQRCFYYEKTPPQTVEIRELASGQAQGMTFPTNEIAFLLAGEIRFTIGGLPEKKLNAGEFVFIPVGSLFHYAVCEKAKVVIFRLNGNVKLCEGCYIEDLYAQFDRKPEAAPESVFTLPINSPLQDFLDGLVEVIRDGLSCRYYFDLKISEFFILLLAYYTQESLRAFFSTILSPDTAFSEYVRTNHRHYVTIAELALSMNITPKHFEKVFCRVFGTTPGKWLKREKARLIHHELRSNGKPIKQIADEYGFSSQQQLNRFCVRELRKNPGEIRLGKSDK